MKKIIISSSVILLVFLCAFYMVRHKKLLSGNFKTKATIAVDSIGRLSDTYSDIRLLDAQKAVSQAGYEATTLPDKRISADLGALLDEIESYYRSDAIFEQFHTAPLSIEEADFNIKEAERHASDQTKRWGAIKVCLNDLETQLSAPTDFNTRCHFDKKPSLTR